LLQNRQAQFNKFAVRLAEKYRPCDAVKAKIEKLITL
jgi:hypothetical protein